MPLLNSYEEAAAAAKRLSDETGEVVHVRQVGAAYWSVTSPELRRRDEDEREYYNSREEHESEAAVAEEAARHGGIAPSDSG